MKIGFVYASKASKEMQLPLGLGYIASYVLQNNRDILITTLDTGVSTAKETDKYLAGQFDLVGFSVTSRNYREAVHIAGILKAGNSKLPIVFGGPHVSIMMDELLKEPLIDFGIYGEGEITFNELIKCIQHSNPEENTFHGIEGLIFRENGKVIVNPPRPHIADLDSLPFPAYDLFPMERYTPMHALISSRGCPFSCVFCASSNIWGHKWRARSAANIMEEICYLLDKYGTKPLCFHDDTFNSNRKRVHQICDMLLDKKIKVPWLVRGFRSDLIDDETAKKMRLAGCALVGIGIESANPEVLKRMNKQETKEQISRGIKALHGAGIDVVGQFMIGNPGETIETVKESIRFVQENGLSKAVFGSAVPFPRTGLWDYVVREGKFLVDTDCTQFEEIYPRVIFETPSFTRYDMLEAMKLVRDAGIQVEGLERNVDKDSLRSALKDKVLRIIFRYLPSNVSYNIYFLLRKMAA